jgi:hypothetical protein
MRARCSPDDSPVAYIKHWYSLRLETVETKERLLDSELDETSRSVSPARLRASEVGLGMAAKKVLMLCGDYMEDYEVSFFLLLFSLPFLLNYLCLDRESALDWCILKQNRFLN